MFLLVFFCYSHRRKETLGGQRLPKRATHPADLHQVGYHDDAGRLLLPYHPPEIVHRLVHGTCARLARSVISEKFLEKFNGDGEGKDTNLQSFALTYPEWQCSGWASGSPENTTHTQKKLRICRTCRPRFTLSAGTSNFWQDIY